MVQLVLNSSTVRVHGKITYTPVRVPYIFHQHLGLLVKMVKAGIPRRRHQHGHPREDPRRHVRRRLKLFLWQAERHADILATILASLEDVGDEVRVGVGVRVRVGAVECQLKALSCDSRGL